MQLSQITIYPVKSMGGISLEQSELDQFGLKYDRRWMVVDKDGLFLTQRQNARMCFFKVELLNDSLAIRHMQYPDWQISVPLKPVSRKLMDVQVWSDVVKGHIVHEHIDKELSRLFEREVHLVMMPNDQNRQVDTKYAPQGTNTAYSDGYPLLMIGQSSLNQLNTRLSDSIEMQCFRPNLVFTGGEAHCEDQQGLWRIGSVEMEAVKPCSRCVVTTINPKTSEKSPEPLRTLSTYRLQDGKVMFGMNMLHKTQTGILKLGDKVEFLG